MNCMDLGLWATVPMLLLMSCSRPCCSRQSTDQSCTGKGGRFQEFGFLTVTSLRMVYFSWNVAENGGDFASYPHMHQYASRDCHLSQRSCLRRTPRSTLLKNVLTATRSKPWGKSSIEDIDIRQNLVDPPRTWSFTLEMLEPFLTHKHTPPDRETDRQTFIDT